MVSLPYPGGRNHCRATGRPCRNVATGLWLLPLLLALLLFQRAPQAAGQAAQPPWPSFGHDAQHTSRSPYAGPEKPAILWQFTAEGAVSGPPVVAADGTVYFGAKDGNLYALNPDGSEKWRYQTGGDIFSSPALAPDGAIYVASSALHAISPAGALLWRLPISSGSTGSSPAVAADGTIYLGSADDSLYAVDPSGRQKWRYETGRDINGSPAIALDGAIYFASGDSGHGAGSTVLDPEYKVYALHPDGTLKWTYDLPLAAASPAVGPDGTVYLGSSDSSLIALHADGALRWRYTTTARVQTTPAIGADGTVYATSIDGVLYAVNSQGRHDWLERTGSTPTAPAVDGSGAIWVGVASNSPSSSIRLLAFNPDGVIRSSYALSPPFRPGTRGFWWGFTSSPVPGADGIIYTGATDNRLLALGQGSAAAGLPLLLYIGLGLGVLLLAGLSFVLWRRLRRPAAKDEAQRRWAGLPPSSGARRLLADGIPATRSTLVRALAAIPNPLAPRIKLAVEADKQDLAYGDRLGVTITVRASRKATLRRLAVEMVYAGEHRRTIVTPVTKIVPTGGRALIQRVQTLTVDEATFTGEHLHNTQVLGENMAVSWMTDTIRAYFDIDADTPPTYRGMRMELNWTVRAVAHPAWGRTVRSLPIRLTLPAAPAAAVADAPRSAVNRGDEYDLELSLPRSRLVAGDVLSAMVEVRPHTTFTAERIEAMLAWSEGLVMTRFSRTQEVEQRREIAGKTDFKQGAARQIPIEFKIPLTTSSSMESPLPLLFWVLRVSLWQDKNSVQDVELPVHIWNPNPAPAPEAAPARGRRRGRAGGRKAARRPDDTPRSHSASVG